MPSITMWARVNTTSPLTLELASGAIVPAVTLAQGLTIGDLVRVELTSGGGEYVAFGVKGGTAGPSEFDASVITSGVFDEARIPTSYGINAGTIPIRNADGKLRAAAPTVSGDVANKDYVDAAVSAGYHLKQIVVFTSSGTFSKASYAWLRAIRVRVQGAGGAGGGCAATSGANYSLGAGGGAGGYAEALITDIAGLASSVTVTVGAGGTGVSGDNGGAGGSSSFGSLVAATGGTGGARKINDPYAPYQLPGEGGSGTAGDLLLVGNGGGVGAGYSTLGSSGPGGGAQLGGGGRAVAFGSGSTSNPGNPGGNYGGGGSGAYGTATSVARAGGNGAPGIVILELFA